MSLRWCLEAYVSGLVRTANRLENLRVANIIRPPVTLEGHQVDAYTISPMFRSALLYMFLDVATSERVAGLCRTTKGHLLTNRLLNVGCGETLLRAIGSVVALAGLANLIQLLHGNAFNVVTINTAQELAAQVLSHC